MPFCACGLVAGAYAFLLLALAVQGENAFDDGSPQRVEEIEALLTNVKVILAGLEAYGVMWSGIEIMAGMIRISVCGDNSDVRLPRRGESGIGSCDEATQRASGAN